MNSVCLLLPEISLLLPEISVFVTSWTQCVCYFLNSVCLLFPELSLLLPELSVFVTSWTQFVTSWTQCVCYFLNSVCLLLPEFSVFVTPVICVYDIIGKSTIIFYQVSLKDLRIHPNQITCRGQNTCSDIVCL
jgi:hypothetical protein